MALHDEDHILKPNPLDSSPSDEDSLQLDISLTRCMPLAEQLTSAWKSRGYRMNVESISSEAGGLMCPLRTVYKGTRSLGACFVRGKSNITIHGKSFAHRVVINHDAAEGIIVQEHGGGGFYKSRQEVILCCGVFESPKLLMLSGIGPMEQLSHHGIPCVTDSPHVGRNLQDHPVMAQVFQVKDNLSMDCYLRPGSERDKAILQHQQSRTGPLTSGLLGMAAFSRIDDRLKTCKKWREATQEIGCDPLGPENQPHVGIDFVNCYAKPLLPRFDPPSGGAYMTTIISLLRPQSRGTVSLASNNPNDKPVINLNMLAKPVDVSGLREGIRFINEVLENGESIRDVIIKEYPNRTPQNLDKDLEQHIHRRLLAGNDSCGTCRMGRDTQQGVVDSRLRVYGTKKLRVIDASVFPVIPDARLLNTVYMIAEKGAEMIKEDHEDLWPKQPKLWHGLEGLSKRLFGIRNIYMDNVTLLREAMKG